MNSVDVYRRALATNMPKPCEKCESQATLWIEAPPNKRHRYRVECRSCQHFNKWGTEDQLQEAERRGLDLVVKKYEPPELGNTFDE